MPNDLNDQLKPTLQKWSTELTAALNHAGFGCEWKPHTGSSTMRLGTLTVHKNGHTPSDIRYIIEFERKLLIRKGQRTLICGVEVYNPYGQLHVHMTVFSDKAVAKIVEYAKHTIEVKLARKRTEAERDERLKKGWEIYNAGVKGFEKPDWVGIRPNIESDADVGTFRLTLNDHYRDWPGARLTLEQAKQVVDYIRALTCSHKFVDSNHCLKCGWEAPKVVGTHTGHRVPNSGTCEKCNATTNWVVDVSGRVAYWCGCGN